MPIQSIPSPIAAASNLAEAVLLAVEPGAPARLASIARQAWQGVSDALTLRQAVTLVACERPWADTLVAMGISTEGLTLLPRALALVAVTSAAADWSAVEPEVAPGLAELVLRRLHTAGYTVSVWDASAIYACAWLSTSGHPADAATALLVRAEELLPAGLAGSAQSLALSRGLFAAGRRRIQFERVGLILPSEARSIVGDRPWLAVSEATGVPSSALSMAMTGVRRWPDAAALWLFDLSDGGAAALSLARERPRRGRPRLQSQDAE